MQTNRQYAPTDFSYDFEVPLTPGRHTFKAIQSPDFPVTSWTITVTLLAADPLQIFSVTPNTVHVNASTPVRINGFNFMNGATVNLISGTDVYTLTNVSYSWHTRLNVTIPDTMPVGTYDVVVTNPDTQTDTLVAGLTVANYFIYFPVMVTD